MAPWLSEASDDQKPTSTREGLHAPGSCSMIEATAVSPEYAKPAPTASLTVSGCSCGPPSGAARSTCGAQLRLRSAALCRNAAAIGCLPRGRMGDAGCSITCFCTTNVAAIMKSGRAQAKMIRVLPGSRSTTSTCCGCG